MLKFIIVFIFWLIIQMININHIKKNKSKDLVLAQNISSLINSIIMILYFLFIKKIDKKLNIIIFITYYLTDLLYYFTYFATNIDLEIEKNLDDEKKKGLIKNRYLFITHHIVALILLFSVYENINNKEIFKYTNIFIFLMELPTMFLCLMTIFKKIEFKKLEFISTVLFNTLFIICRTFLFNIFLYILLKNNYHKFSKNKNIKNLNLIIINLAILSIGNIVQGIINAKYLYKIILT